MTANTNTDAVTGGLRARVREVVRDTLEFEPSEITSISPPKEEHGADSMGAIDTLVP